MIGSKSLILNIDELKMKKFSKNNLVIILLLIFLITSLKNGFSEEVFPQKETVQSFLASSQTKEVKKDPKDEKGEGDKTPDDELDLKKFFERDISAIESHINFQGRKMIEAKLGNSYWVKDKERKDKPPSGGLAAGVDINQELQVRVLGNIQDRIFTDIDYDDTVTDTQTRQKFHIEYKGKEKEVVKEAAFGDLQLSLPNTEFVSYNKNLFGIKAAVNYKKLSVIAVASRTKGIPESKTFKGYSEQRTIDISDTNFMERKYYQILAYLPYLSPPKEIGKTLPLEVGSVKIYLDNRVGSDNQKATTAAGKSFNNQNYYRGENSFDELYPISDYVIDHQTGMVSLRKNIGQDNIILVAFKSTLEKRGYDDLGNLNKEDLLMIKAASDIPTKEGYSSYNKEYYKFFEQNGYYSLEMNSINLDDKDFLLEIRDLNNKNYDDKNNNNVRDGDEDAYLFIFGLDKNKDNLVDYEYIDVDFGLLHFPSFTPFLLTDDDQRSNKDLYDTPNKKPKYKIHVEYKSKKKEFFLSRINIVIDSERIYLDGKLLKKDQDYLIDYFSGWITFLREEEIDKQSEIKVDYEYMPFGGLFRKNLLGVRGTLDLSKNICLGSTYIYEGSSQVREIPEITSSPESLSLIDIDTKINISSMIGDLFNLPSKDWQMAISGEIAKSQRNWNTFGKAIIDNMEGNKISYHVSLDEDSWNLGWLSSGEKRGKLLYKLESYNERAGPYNEEVGHLNDEEKKNSLVLKYENTLEQRISIVNSLSNPGVDLSGYKYLEIWAKIPKQARLYLDLGMVCEDADGDGILDSEDKNKDLLLNSGEDTGWEFNEGKEVITKVGKGNSKIDSEDLDKDGILDTQEKYFTVEVKDTYQSTSLPEKTNPEWKFYLIPCLDIEKTIEGSNEEKKKLWEVIKHLRLRVEGGESGEINIDQISFVANKWQGKDIIVKSLNSQDNPEYKSLKDDLQYGKDFKDLYKYVDLEKEEALVLNYDLEKNKEGFAFYKYKKAQNYTGYKYLNYFVYGDGKGEEFFIWLGNDDQNYLKYKSKMDFTGWKLIKVDLIELNRHLLKLQLGGSPPYSFQEGSYEIKGNPSLSNINEVRLGIRGDGQKGEIWVNEVFLSENMIKEGQAKRVTINTNYKDFLNLKWSKKEIDRNFENIDRVSPLQDKEWQNFDASLSIIKCLPMNYSFQKEKTLTDPAEDPVRSENITISNFGQRIFRQHNTGVKFSLPKLPTVKANYVTSKNKNDYQNEERMEDSKALSVNMNYQYQFPLKIWIIPTGESLSVSLVCKYNGEIRKTEYPREASKDSYLREKGLGNSITINYTPISILGINTLFNFERKDQKERESYYPKFRLIENNYDLNIYKIKGLAPKVGLKSFLSEDYLIKERYKNVKTNLSFNVGSNIALGEWWLPLKLVVFNPSYSLSLAASYDKISGDLNTKDTLKEIYRDYYLDKLLFNHSKSRSSLESLRKSASKKATYDLSSNWYLWKPLDLSITSTLEKNTQQTLSSIRYQESITYRGTSRFNLMKIFSKLKDLAESSYLILNYSRNKITEPAISTFISINPDTLWSVNWNKSFRSSLSMNYKESKKIYPKNTTLSKTVMPKLLLNYTVLKPKKIKILFTKKYVYLKNRLENKLSLDGVLNKEDTGQTKKETRQYNLGLGCDYKVKDTVIVEVWTKSAYFQDKIEKYKDYFSYEASVKVEFRF
ncbi:hypothetical protein KJ849_05485 [bacterium]|nr:hypothetical protein [bacterium]